MQQKLKNEDTTKQPTEVAQRKEKKPKKNRSTIQAKGLNGKPLQPIPSKQGSQAPIQAKGLNGKPLQPIQTKQGSQAPIQAKQQPVQRNSNSNGLPHQLQSNMESMGGVDLSDVKVHRNSDKPAQLKAHAYAQGSDIHLAPGQDKHLPHEAWHVVQQKQGRVQATTQMKNSDGKVGINDNPALEREADVMGDKASKGIVQTKTSNMSNTAGNGHNLKVTQAKSQVIQRAIKTSGGEWDTDKFDLRKDKNAYGKAYAANLGVRGVDMGLKFTPNDTVDATAIGLIQSVQCYVNGAPSYTDNHKKNTRSIPNKDASKINTGVNETNEGTAIDRVSSKNNPIYGSPHIDASKSLEDTPSDNNSTGKATSVGLGGGHNATYQLGYRYEENKSVKKKSAKLYDGPTRSGAAKDSRHVFETTALATKGNQKDTFYGSVRWGWRTDSAGTFTKIPLQVVSQGVPSSTFIKAAKIWNKGKDSGGTKNITLPTPEIHTTQKDDQKLYPEYWDDKHIKLPKGTRIKVSGWYFGYTYAEVVDGPHVGEKGYIDNDNYKEEE